MGTGVWRWTVGGWAHTALGLGLLCEAPFLLSGDSPGLPDTLSFHLAPQIEPSSHHLSPEEVRSRVLGGGQKGAGKQPHIL